LSPQAFEEFFNRMRGCEFTPTQAQQLIARINERTRRQAFIVEFVGGPRHGHRDIYENTPPPYIHFVEPPEWKGYTPSFELPITIADCMPRSRKSRYERVQGTKTNNTVFYTFTGIE
jgi:hypothetical protein